MIELKGRKDRPSLGIYMERQSQRGRWEEPFCQDRSGKTFLNFPFWIDFVFGILGYSSGADSLLSSKVTGTQEVGL